MTKKLEETFNIDGDGCDENVVVVFELEIPVDANLGDISKLALNAYKMQMENIQHIEPQYRSRALEVAKQYLELAKSAIADDLKYQQSQEKLDRENTGNDTGSKTDDSDPVENSAGISRHELLLALSKTGKKKTGQEEPDVSQTGTG